MGGGGNMGNMPFELRNPSIPLSVLSMGLYLAVGFVLSLWVSKRRQLA
jgi:hypothetical protein